jgi:hypothetical protein
VLVAHVIERLSESEAEAASALGRHASSTPHPAEQCWSNFSTCLLACNAIYIHRYLPTFRKIFCLHHQGGTSNRLHGVTSHSSRKRQLSQFSHKNSSFF